MRTLTSTLLAEQQKAAYTPYIQIQLKPVSGSTLTYATDDATDRILSVVRHDNTFAVGDTNFAAIIRFNNFDKHFETKNLEGYAVRIKRGFMISGSPETAGANTAEAPLWVLSQRDISLQGQLVTELDCIDILQRLARYLAMSGVIRLGGDAISGSFTHGEGVTGGTSGATAKLWVVGPTYILVKAASGTFSATETVTGDSSGDTITNVTVTNPGVGLPPLWEQDTAISDIIKELMAICELDSADQGLTVDIAEPSSPDPPGNLQAYQPYFSIGSSTGGFNIDYLSMVKALMGITKSGLRFRDGSDARGGMRMLYLDSSPQSRLVGTITGTYTPGELVTQASSGATGRVVYQNSTTFLVIEANTGTFNTTNIVTGGSSGATMTPSSIATFEYEYDYSSDHAFFSNIRDRHLVIPSRVIVVNKMPDPDYIGTDVNQAAIDAFGTTAMVVVGNDLDEIPDTDTATKRADALMHQLESEKNIGQVVVPMNVGQEVWDMVRVTDTRTNLTTTQRVTGLTWTYTSGSPLNPDPSIYALELRFGALVSRFRASLERNYSPEEAKEPTTWLKDLIATMNARLEQMQLEMWEATQRQMEANMMTLVAAMNLPGAMQNPQLIRWPQYKPSFVADVPGPTTGAPPSGPRSPIYPGEPAFPEIVSPGRVTTPPKRETDPYGPDWGGGIE